LKQAADDAEVERLDRRAFTRHLVEFVHAFERDPKDATAAATKYDPLWAEGVGGTVTPDQIRRAVNFVTAVVAAMQEPEAP
jgi:triosephosphate isomerase